MKRQSIVISEGDMERLSCLIRGARLSLLRDQQELNLLDNVLQNAEVRPPQRTPKSIVRMTSKVQVRDIRTRKEDVYTVVFPDEADASVGLISVLAPIGIALIGRRKGAVAEAKVPGGIRRLQIVHVIQSHDSFTNSELPAGRQITPANLVEDRAVAYTRRESRGGGTGAGVYYAGPS